MYTIIINHVVIRRLGGLKHFIKPQNLGLYKYKYEYMILNLHYMGQNYHEYIE